MCVPSKSLFPPPSLAQELMVTRRQDHIRLLSNFHKSRPSILHSEKDDIFRVKRFKCNESSPATILSESFFDILQHRSQKLLFTLLHGRDEDYEIKEEFC